MIYKCQTFMTFNSRYLLLMLVIHAMTLEHIGGLYPPSLPSQLLFPGFIK